MGKNGGQEYYLGLDMGTNSVGWAVTDPNYNLLRAKGKDMWGIREFDRAETAAERRSHRVSRRNHQRSQVRIGLVKSIFADAVFKEDPNFYCRMDNSFYKQEDKDSTLNSLDSVFADQNYRDADYFKEYPTIFHLKYDLIKDEVAVDERYARKVYLAVLHYFKKRGHFLNESLSGDNEDGDIDISASLYQLDELCENLFDSSFSFNDERIIAVKAIFADDTLSRSRRREKLMEVLQVEKKDVVSFLILGAICGLKVDLAKMPGLDNGQKVELDFTSASLEEKLPDILSVVGDEYEDFIECLKHIYDSGVLTKMLSGKTEDGSPVRWLSQARVLSYEKHKKDLALLKACIKDYCTTDEYDYLFRSDSDASYSAYVGSVNNDKVKARRGGNLHKSKSGDRYANLKKRIQKDLSAYGNDERVAYILEELDRESFLPKQLTYANGVIPNQLHEKELRRILENASKHMEFLNQVDESGLSAKDRIISLFTFNIPYYIGPTSQAYKGNGWAVRKPGMEGAKVYPWNIEEVIDYNATNEEFIKRMVRDCTYISGEKVLPKESLMYQSFMVLNTINNLRINNEKISCQLKQDIYHELFEQEKKNVTRNAIVKYLVSRGLIKEDCELSGIDGNSTIGPQLTTYKRFYAILGDDIKLDTVRTMVERIVEWGTIYGDSKKMFRSRIEEAYGDRLDANQVKRIVGFKFKDWGNLSGAFLSLQGVNYETDDQVSLIRALWEDDNNLNLTELLNSDHYSFKDNLREKTHKNIKTLCEFHYEDLEGMYYSAPVKRMIWQTIQIMQEIEKIMGCAPKRVFVEVTRSDEEKGEAGRKDSREKELLEKYKSIKDDRDWDKEIKEAGASGKLRSKKMYLYYTQMGCDAYTGLPIDLADLFDDNKYDIDHIYPRHFVKDDSIRNNLVLVDKRKNSRKSDNYPIDSEIRNNPQVKALWERLRYMKLITEEKYRRLTGTVPFTDEEKVGFINRQIVETGQATKGICDLLGSLMPENTQIVYCKSKNVSDFRNQFGFYKSRLLNDFHHAHDAYLNIVVGNVYFTKFTLNPMNFIKKENGSYHLGRMFDKDVVRNGYYAWHAPKYDEVHREILEENESLQTVRNMLGKNTPLLTRMPVTQHGALFDATVYGTSKVKKDAYLGVKSSASKLADVEKYGGVGSIKNAYFFVVEHEVQGKGKDKGKSVNIRTIEALPVYKIVEVEKKGLVHYCNELGLVNPRIIMSKLKPQSLISVDGFLLYITGKSSERFVVRNAVNLIIDSKWNKYIHGLEKYSAEKVIMDYISCEENILLYDELAIKHSKGLYSRRPNSIGEMLINGREMFVNLAIEEQIYVLLQIINLSKICDSSTADLVAIGGSTKSGATLIGKEISKYSDFCVLTQSVTGLISRKIDLIKI